MAEWALRLRDTLWDHPGVVVLFVFICVYSYDVYARVRGRRWAQKGACSRCGRRPPTAGVSDDFVTNLAVCGDCRRAILARYRVGYYMFVVMVAGVGIIAVMLATDSVGRGQGVPWAELERMVWPTMVGVGIAFGIRLQLRKGTGE